MVNQHQYVLPVIKYKKTAETSKNSKFNFLANACPSAISIYLIAFKSDLVATKTPYTAFPNYFFNISNHFITLLKLSLLDMS